MTEYVERVRVEHANFYLNAPASTAQYILPVPHRDKENSFNEVRGWVFESVTLLLNHFVELKPFLLGVVYIDELLKNLVEL